MTTTHHMLQAYLRTADLNGITSRRVADGMGVPPHRLQRHADYQQALFDERVRRCVVNPGAPSTELHGILGLKSRSSVLRHYRAAWGRDPRSQYIVRTCPRDDIEAIMQLYRDAGCTVKYLARKSGHGLRQLYRWIRVYKQHGPMVFPPREWF